MEILIVLAMVASVFVVYLMIKWTFITFFVLVIFGSILGLAMPDSDLNSEVPTTPTDVNVALMEYCQDHSKVAERLAQDFLKKRPLSAVMAELEDPMDFTMAIAIYEERFGTRAEMNRNPDLIGRIRDTFYSTCIVK